MTDKLEIFEFLKDSHLHSDKYDVDIEWIRNETEHGIRFTYDGVVFESFIEGIGDLPGRKDFYEESAVDEADDVIEGYIFERDTKRRYPNAVILSPA